MLKPSIGAVMLGALLSATSALTPAQADEGNVSLDYGDKGSNSATVDIGAEHIDSGSDSASGGGEDAAQAGSASAQKRECTYRGADVPCTSDLGVWSSERQCFVQRVSPQPESVHAIWEGREDGTIYQCSPPDAAFSAGTGVGFWFWAPSAGSSGSPVLVDPVTVAERAVESMALRSPEIGMTPLREGAPLLVGMDAWLWVDNAGPRGFGPITRTATAGPVSVTATAKVTKVLWDLGDGTRLTCRSAGTPWSADRGTGASPTCGHRYLSPSSAEEDGSFTVRATAHWLVTWTGAGQSGQITFTMTGQREQPVTEVQVLQTQ